MRFWVTVTDERGEVLSGSEQTVAAKELPAEGREVGREAWMVALSRRDKPADYPGYSNGDDDDDGREA